MVSRAQHRRDTLTRIGEAAIHVFDREGPSATIDRIAEEAGVSRRTIFRWVDSKEQLAFVHPMLWFDVFDDALAMGSETSPTLEARLRSASGAIAAHIDNDPEPPRRAFMVAAQHPELLSGFNVVFQQWVDRIAREVLASAPTPTTADTHLRSRIIGAATMGMVDAVTRAWLIAPADTSFAELHERGFDLLAPLFTE